MRDRRFRFSIRTTLVATIVLGSFLGWWVDMPRRTALEIRDKLADGDLDAANSMLAEPAKFRKPDGTKMIYLVTPDGGFPCGTSESWAKSSIECEPCSIVNRLKRRRVATITGLRPNTDGIKFHFEGSVVTAAISNASLQ